MQTKVRQKGFTIVELLIVIVVIGILAAITIVVYNGIQNRANDAVVQSDLVNYAKKARLFRIDSISDAYPDSAAELVSLGVRASQSSYDTVQNLLYCRTTGSPIDFSFVAKSKSGTILYVSSKDKGTAPGGSVTGAVACDTVGLVYPPGTGAVMVGRSGAGVWQTWTQ